jgi:hypothetical protein
MATGRQQNGRKIWRFHKLKTNRTCIAFNLICDRAVKTTQRTASTMSASHPWLRLTNTTKNRKNKYPKKSVVPSPFGFFHKNVLSALKNSFQERIMSPYCGSNTLSTFQSPNCRPGALARTLRTLWLCWLLTHEATWRYGNACPWRKLLFFPSNPTRL